MRDKLANALGLAAGSLGGIAQTAVGRSGGGYTPPAAPPGAVPTVYEHHRQQRVAEAMQPFHALMEQARTAEAQRIRTRLFGGSDNKAFSLISHLLASHAINRNLRPYMSSVEAEVAPRILAHQDVHQGPLEFGQRRYGQQQQAANQRLVDQYLGRMQHFLRGMGYTVHNGQVGPNARNTDLNRLTYEATRFGD